MNKSNGLQAATKTDALCSRRRIGKELSMDRCKTKAVRVSAASRGVLCLLVGLLWSPGLRAQTPEEHASHHPDANSATPTANSPAGMGGKPDAMSGMGTSAPAAAPQNSSGMGEKKEQTGGMGTMMSGMGKMMEGMMGGSPQKELYPSLMALPNLSPEQRLQLQQQAEGRAKMGAALLQQGTARMANPEANALELQEGAADARAGLKEMESGQAARRALAEGRPPRAVALPWFQSEMNLASPLPHNEPGTLRGVTPFHLFTMGLLIVFALAMVVMYFFKMRRAAALFGRIESDAGSPPPGESPPLSDGKTPPPGGSSGGSGSGGGAASESR